jgi:hypothetical protein
MTEPRPEDALAHAAAELRNLPSKLDALLAQRDVLA